MDLDSTVLLAQQNPSCMLITHTDLRPTSARHLVRGAAWGRMTTRGAQGAARWRSRMREAVVRGSRQAVDFAVMLPGRSI